MCSAPPADSLLTSKLWRLCWPAAEPPRHDLPSQHPSHHHQHVMCLFGPVFNDRSSLVNLAFAGQPCMAHRPSVTSTMLASCSLEHGSGKQVMLSQELHLQRSSVEAVDGVWAAFPLCQQPLYNRIAPLCCRQMPAHVNAFQFALHFFQCTITSHPYCRFTMKKAHAWM